MATYKNPFKGKRDTPAGVMPEDMAIRHKLVGIEFCGACDPSYKKVYRRNRRIKELFQMAKTYRLMVHGVHERKLASTLRHAVHFLVEPMARSSGGASNWAKSASQESDDSLAAVQKPLKI